MLKVNVFMLSTYRRRTYASIYSYISTPLLFTIGCNIFCVVPYLQCVCDTSIGKDITEEDTGAATMGSNRSQASALLWIVWMALLIGQVSAQ